MTVEQVIEKIEERFSPKKAEEFDNVGLLCGELERKISGILVCHDAIEESIEEAIARSCNFILCFHPIIFSALKSLTGKNYVERAVMKAIENKIALYAVHTSLDNDFFGINYEMGQKLGLKKQGILIPKKRKLMQLSVFVPDKHAESLKNALFEAGAGEIGFYDQCSFSLSGEGSFRPKRGANPFIGSLNTRENLRECMVLVGFESRKTGQVLSAMRENHPYEEISYFLQTCENENKYEGMGGFGLLESDMSEERFLHFVKEKFSLKSLRHSKLLGNRVKRVGLLAGSGAFGIEKAIAANCDAYLTGDLKYHDFFRSEGKILLVDMGHYESEQLVVDLLHRFLCEKITNFTPLKSEISTNPVNYF